MALEQLPRGAASSDHTACGFEESRHESDLWADDADGSDPSASLLHRLRADWERVKEAELRRLLQKTPGLGERAEQEIERSLQRLMNTLLHPAMESLRRESREGNAASLSASLARLFQLGE